MLSGQGIKRLLQHLTELSRSSKGGRNLRASILMPALLLLWHFIQMGKLSHLSASTRAMLSTILKVLLWRRKSLLIQVRLFPPHCLRSTDTLLALTAVQFHPDGHLLACGATNTDIKVFDVKSGSNAANFAMTGPLQSLYFSENGTWLAAVSKGQSSVAIWDLRKAAQVKSLETGGRVDSLAWDWTGQYLVTGGPAGCTVQRYSKAEKEWTEPLRAAVPAVAVQWGEKASSLVTVNEEGRITVVGEKS